jgi:phage-related tail protein
VAHVYNPSYSGDRDQEDHSSKAAWGIVQETLTLKLTLKRAGGVAQGVGPEFKYQYCKKKKKKRFEKRKVFEIQKYVINTDLGCVTGN